MKSAVALYLPLLLIGALAGLVYTLSSRARTPKARRALHLAWILMILLGAPVWLVVAATLGWL